MNKAISHHVPSAGCALCLRRHQCASKQSADSAIPVRTELLPAQKLSQKPTKPSFQNYKNHAGTTL
ncbi:hypothetical protein [Spirosoma endophyticum]|uniref:hypothetical protein n=1 Tax=Spirosoma endophyticum TaxID=662367 RepID=UPI0015A51EC6|nr:hypothetical protein [Spirosoma endophyticum]